MIAHIRNVYVSLLAFIRRLDRWLLLREPMLWRTRPVYLLVLLSLAVIAAVPFMQTSIKDPIEAADLGSKTVTCWWWRLFGVIGVILLWIQSINNKPVGELAPHRHIVTVIAVAIGSYLWLVTPSLLAYPQINAIKQVKLSEKVNEDVDFLSQYSDWTCVPQVVWDNKSELKRLGEVLARYYGREVEFKKGQIERITFIQPCHANGDRPLDPSSLVDRGKEAIGTIKDAGRPNEKNQFYWIRYPWWLAAAAALGIGLLTAILSYPTYVWRRTFGRD